MATSSALTVVAGLSGFFIRDLLKGYLQQQVSNAPAIGQEYALRIEYRPTRCHPTVLPPSTVERNENVLPTVSDVWIAVLLALFILLLTIVAFGRWTTKTADLMAQVERLAKKATYHNANGLARVGVLQARINSRQHELNGARRRILEQGTEERTLKAYKNRLKHSLDGEKKLARQADQNSKMLNGQLATATEEIKALNGQLATAVEETKALKGQLTTAQNGAEKRKKTVDSVSEELETAKRQIETLQRENDQLSRDKKRFQTSASDEKRATLDAKKDASKLRDQLKTANDRATSL